MNATAPDITTEEPILDSIPNTGRLLGGLGRSSIYNLLDTQQLKGVTLRVKGNVRGRRMVLRESINAYVARMTA